MLRHPPVMTKSVVQGALHGRRWRDVKRKAEDLAAQAVRMGLVGASESERTAIGLQPSSSSAASAAKKGIDLSEEKLGNDPSEPQRATSSALIPMDTPAAAQRFTEIVVSTFGESGDLVQYAGNQDRVPRLVSFDVLDCTLGGGHHAAAMLTEGAPYTRVVGIDCDHAVRRTAAAMVETFGSRRFQFFPNRMSEIFELFGPNAFDAVMIDPGANMDQIDDPSRGFGIDLSMTPGDLPLDMRYGPAMRSTAADWLSGTPEPVMVQALAYYGDLPPVAARKFVKLVKQAPRPVATCGELAAVLHAALPEPVEARIVGETGGQVLDDFAGPQSKTEFGGHPWLRANAQPAARRSFAHRAVNAIRCAVNDERRELLEGLRQSLEVVRPDGRVVVLARERWQRDLLSWFTEEHPFALAVMNDPVDREEAAVLLQPPETVCWGIQRSKTISYKLKNAINPPTSAEMQESFVHWLSGQQANVQTRGFPAFRFSKHKLTDDDKRTRRKIERAAREIPPNNDRTPARQVDNQLRSVAGNRRFGKS